MEKQVKVNVSWNKRCAGLSTDRGMDYYFGTSSQLPERGSCETIVSSLIASLIVPTVHAFMKDSGSDEFSFEFKVMDKKES